MPDDVRISELTPISSIGNNDLMEVSHEDSAAESGYVSTKMTMTQLSDKLNNNIQYVSDLETASKTIIGGINSLLANMTTPYANLSFPIAQGVCCSHEGLVYQANQAIPTSEAWTPAHWTQVVLTDLIGSGGGGGSSGTYDYSELFNKPRVNNVELNGNKSTADLHIDYDDLENKPDIPDNASDIEYSSGVSVADKLGEIPTLNDFIKVTSQSGTTTGGGVLSKTFAHKVVVLSAWASIDNCIVDIYKDGVDFDDTGSLVWNFHCHNASNQAWGNTNLTIRMTYIDYNA